MIFITAETDGLRLCSFFKSSAQITKKYSKENLIGRLIVCVTNFHPKQIANFISEVLVLGVESKGKVILLNLDEEVELGKRIC